MAALDERDTMATNHRGHGHVIARGIDLDMFFMEIMGKSGGVCRGRGGSMHVADMNLGIIGDNGLVAAGIPLALGSALAHSVRKTGRSEGRRVGKECVTKGRSRWAHVD